MDKVLAAQTRVQIPQKDPEAVVHAHNSVSEVETVGPQGLVVWTMWRIDELQVQRQATSKK